MRRVLLVDGDDETLERCAHELQHAGYEVVATHEEDEALVAVGAAAFDVVVLDLPEVEASEAARAIVATSVPSTRRVLIAAVVDRSLSSHARAQLRRDGVDYLLLRPCPPAALLQHLDRWTR